MDVVSTIELHPEPLSIAARQITRELAFYGCSSVFLRRSVLANYEGGV